MIDSIAAGCLLSVAFWGIEKLGQSDFASFTGFEQMLDAGIFWYWTIIRARRGVSTQSSTPTTSRLPSSAKKLTLNERLPRLASLPDLLHQSPRLEHMSHTPALDTLEPLHDHVPLLLLPCVTSSREHWE